MTIRATVTDVDDTAGGTAIDLIAPSAVLSPTPTATRILTVRGDPVCLGGDADTIEFVDGSTGASASAGKEGYYLADGESITIPYSGETLLAITASSGSSTIHVFAPYGPAA